MNNARTITDWHKLDAAAQEAGFYQFTMGAEENASDTVYVEKAAPVEEFAELCFGSLEMLLADSGDAAAHAFFRAHGIRF